MSLSPRQSAGFERMIFTLPRELATALDRYARAVRGGNKSGFVADALQSHIDFLNRRRHTDLLRSSYAEAAAGSAALTREWQPLDRELSERLGKLEKKHRASR